MTNSSPDLPKIPAEQRPEILISYTFYPQGETESVKQESSDIYSTPLYEYLHRTAVKLPDIAIERHQCYVLFLYPCPIVGVNLHDGTTMRVLAAILCEEVDGDEKSLLPAAERIAAGGRLSAVTGILCETHAEALDLWKDFLEPESDEDDQDDDDDDPSGYRPPPPWQPRVPNPYFRVPRWMLDDDRNK